MASYPLRVRVSHSTLRQIEAILGHDTCPFNNRSEIVRECLEIGLSQIKDRVTENYAES